MTKLAGIALTAMVTLGMMSTSAMADAAKGQKLYTKKLKKACGVSGAKIAGSHTQGEWEKINTDGKLLEEIISEELLLGVEDSLREIIREFEEKIEFEPVIAKGSVSELVRAMRDEREDSILGQ